jgi:GNAT superfamily N-acetyltransferase
MPTKTHHLIAGQAVTIRPIQISDTGLEADFIRRLSPRTKHFRFLGGVRELSPHELSSLCKVDGKYSMAYVATIMQRGQELEIGVARYAPDKSPDVREIALTVADEWQNRGLELTLMKPLIESARSCGVRRLYSVEFSDNDAMRTLAQELGMSARQDPQDPKQTIFSLTL